MKIIASDFDGTLFRGGVSEEDKEAIARWRAAGNLFGVVTGRLYLDALFILKQGVDLDFLINGNGSSILSADGKIIERVSAEGAILPEIARTSREMGAFMMITAREDHQIWADYRKEEDREKLEEILAFDRFQQITLMFPSGELAQAYEDFVRETHGDVLNPMRNNNNVDIPPVGVDKTDGIRRYADMLGLKPEHIITVGDNLNDIAMITAFEGYAMADGRKETIAAAPCGAVTSIADLIGRYMQ